MTHALSGALVARATAPRQPRPDQLSLRERTWIGVLAGTISDIDFVVALFDHVAYLENHRGVANSLLFMPVWAWLLAVACAFVLGRRYPWRAYYGVILLAILAHILGDLITSYGTQIFAPLSNWAPGWNTTFIIDLWLSGLLALGLLASLYWRPRTGAALGLVAVTALVLFQYTQYRNAVELADSWAREQGYTENVAEAYPQPWSPLNWLLVVDRGERYHLARVNLRRQTPLIMNPDAHPLWRIRESYLPVDQLAWRRYDQFGPDEAAPLAREVWSHDDLAFFRWFANYPALQAIDQYNGDQCVIFTDLRFELEGRESPFRYGMCRSAADAEWVLYRMRAGRSRQAL
ncbi:metal-dependent hydrolase [Desulfurivibrio sp. C05AmB]|uniref:metal-dependent hydrolase n=1 Tax=Desulfurivibrio sp. C05AmB TaxID=3374371 RepID=UPI00376EBC20